VSSLAPDFERADLPTAVAAHLARQILSGEIDPGNTLPNYDELSISFGVSKPALREALKILASKGLILSRPRTGTRVRPRSDWRLLDEDMLRWQSQAGVSRSFVNNLIEVRRIFEPAIARLAAERATSRHIEEMADALRVMAAKVNDPPGFVAADVRFHGTMLAAAGNEILTQIGGPVGRALQATDEISLRSCETAQESLPLHRAVLEAIRSHDLEAAAEAMSELIARAERDLAHVIEQTGL
jgi:DNA-binding FadR family transcriptional regulator